MTRAGLPTCSWATATARRGPSVRRLRGCPARCAAMPICARFAYFGCGLISSCRLRRRHRVCNTRVTSGSGFVLSVVSCVCCVCVCVCRVWIWRLVNTRSSYVESGENAETVNGTSADRPPDTATKCVRHRTPDATAHPTRRDSGVNRVVNPNGRCAIHRDRPHATSPRRDTARRPRAVGCTRHALRGSSLLSSSSGARRTGRSCLPLAR